MPTSYNYVHSPLYEACCFNELTKKSLLGPDIVQLLLVKKYDNCQLNVSYDDDDHGICRADTAQLALTLWQCLGALYEAFDMLYWAMGDALYQPGGIVVAFATVDFITFFYIIDNGVASS